MSLFDSAMSVAAEASTAVMGETMTINGVSVTGTVGPVGSAGSRLPERGGRFEEVDFEIHLTVAAAAACSARDGVRLQLANGKKGRVDKVEDLGAGGVVLYVGPVNRGQD